ncbi:UbiA prenyltransferase [Mucidula mucida]|nr:UbiA prenyltransferase [Mucidula mucida]
MLLSQKSSSIFSPKRLGQLLAVPTEAELEACWELCRLHNNIGFWVVWIPTAWSIAMAYHAHPSLTALDCLYTAAFFVPLCFGVKSLIMTIDDILDYDIDALVERTQTRAIPRGAISVDRAWLFFALQVVIGVTLAFKLLTPTSLHISMFAWPLYVIYPTCKVFSCDLQFHKPTSLLCLKRWMNFAPIPLGFMFAVGVFMGWAELNADGRIPYSTLIPVYLSCVCWTIAYETVYQHQDKVDDMKIGLHSPALWCAEYTIPICTCSAIGFLSLLSYGGMLNGHGLAFYLGVIVAGMSLLVPLVKTDIDRPVDCKNLFLGTPRVGQIILGGLVADALIHRWMAGVPF